MAKAVFTFAVLCTGMMLILNMAGVPTGVDSILEFLGLSEGDQDIANSQFVVALLALIAASAVSGIIIGTFTRSSPESFIIAPLVALLAVFIGTFVSVMNYAEQSNDTLSNVVLILMAPLAIGYAISLVYFWRGVD